MQFSSFTIDHGSSPPKTTELSPEPPQHPDQKKPLVILLLIFFLSLLLGTFFCWNTQFSITSSFFDMKVKVGYKFSPKSHNKTELTSLLHCSKKVRCPNTSPATLEPNKYHPSTTECPEYFRWIHEDLRPWKSTGITRDMLEGSRKYANFRLVIVDGKAYVEKLRRDVFQTRDVFTIWGILQLLRLYPGLVPDLELMFNCGDNPEINKSDYQGAKSTSAPPLFRYCGQDSTLDIVFPDWTFWGWAETNIKPWRSMLDDIKEGSKRIPWKDRVPYAYWRGNPTVSHERDDLMKCNISDKHDSGALLYTQNWKEETKKGFKHSSLKDQCTHRYKIYIEGRAWSVSDKYIMACDSMTLLVEPYYHGFFLRSMVPLQHYWPIRTRNKCRDLKFAVQWGNNHTQQAQAIGEAGSKFIQEKLKMEFVYDYMFHGLREYAKLLKFKPKLTPKTEEVCLETVACPTKGLWNKFLVESMVKSPSDTLPCNMLPPYEQAVLQDFLERKESIERHVEMWEAEFWHNSNKS